MGRPAKELTLSTEQRAQLESIARSHSLPAPLVRRAQMIIRMAADLPREFHPLGYLKAAPRWMES